MPTKPRPYKPRQPLFRPILRKSAPFAIKSTALFGGLTALGLTGAKVIESYGDKDDGPPISHDVEQLSGDAYVVRTEDGGTAVVYTSDYLNNLSQYYKDLMEAGLDPTLNPGADPTGPVIIDQPDSPDQGQQTGEKVALTTVAVGLIGLVAFLSYIKK